MSGGGQKRQTKSVQRLEKSGLVSGSVFGARASGGNGKQRRRSRSSSSNKSKGKGKRVSRGNGFRTTSLTPAPKYSPSGKDGLQQLSLVIGQHPEEEEGSAVLTAELQAVTGESVYRPPLDYIFAIDTSESMGMARGEQPAIELVKAALTHHSVGIINRMAPEDRIGIISFATEAKTLMPLTLADDDGKKNAVQCVTSISPIGNTNVYGALLLAFKLAGESKIKGRDQIVFMLSDGKPNEPRVDTGETGRGTPVSNDGETPRGYSDTVAPLIDGGYFLRGDTIVSYVNRDKKHPSVPVHCLGFATDDKSPDALNADLLKSIAKAYDGDYRHVADNDAIMRVILREFLYTSSVVSQQVRVKFSACGPIGAVNLYRLANGGKRGSVAETAVTMLIAQVSHGETKHASVVAVNTTDHVQYVDVEVTYKDTTTVPIKERKLGPKKVQVPPKKDLRPNIAADTQVARYITTDAVGSALQEMKRSESNKPQAKRIIRDARGRVEKIHMKHTTSKGCLCVEFELDLQQCDDEYLEISPFNPKGLGKMYDIHSAHQDERQTDLRGGGETQLYHSDIQDLLSLDLEELDKMAYSSEKFRILRERHENFSRPK